MHFDAVEALAMFVNVRWSVKFSFRMDVLEEQDVVVLDMSWPLPFGHWSTSNEHFWL